MFKKNGFEKVKVEQMLSPKAVRHVLKNYCGWRGNLPKVEEITEEHIKATTNLAEDALDFLKNLPGPIRFRGCGGYSYTFDPKNPLRVLTSDGGELKLEFISDLDEWVGFEGEFIEGICEEMSDLFGTGFVHQEEHETEMIGGTPEKSDTEGGFWG